MSNQANLNDNDIIEQITKKPELIEKVLKTPEVASFLSVIIQQQISHSGPLPLASEVAKYNEVIPNGADRIMTMAEKEQEANHINNQKQLSQRDQELSQRNTQLNHRQTELETVKRGQWFSIIVITLYTTLSAFIAWLGDTVTAGALMGTGLVGIVFALVYGKNNQNK